MKNKLTFIGLLTDLYVIGYFHMLNLDSHELTDIIEAHDLPYILESNIDQLITHIDYSAPLPREIMAKGLSLKSYLERLEDEDMMEHAINKGYLDINLEPDDETFETTESIRSILVHYSGLDYSKNRIDGYILVNTYLSDEELQRSLYDRLLEYLSPRYNGITNFNINLEHNIDLYSSKINKK